MPGVTISAGYGCGGSTVAPTVAGLLGLPMLDRAISSTIAAQLHVSIAEAVQGEEKRSIPQRLLSLLAPLSGGVLGAGTDAAPVDQESLTADESSAFRDQAEAIMRTALAGGAVILGRGGAAAFADEPDVLRVRLFGPEQARIRQGAVVEQVSQDTAAQRLPQVDHARKTYVRRLYHVDIDDPAPFQLQLDSTALSLETCAELIATAYRALVAA